MLANRKVQLQKAIRDLQGMVEAAEKADPNIRRQQMFGGSLEKETEFNENLAKVKERFLHSMYNLTKSKC